MLHGPLAGQFNAISRLIRFWVTAAAIFIVLSAAWQDDARAGESIAPPSLGFPAGTSPFKPGSFEVWFGADAAPHNTLLYSGTTAALWGSVFDDGWRVRASGSIGRYDFYWNKTFRATIDKTYGDITVGFQKRFGNLTAKAFLGAALLGDADIPAAAHYVPRQQIGPKAAIELWLNLSDTAWMSFDVSYASPRNMASAHSRIGYRVFPQLSLGFEAAINYASMKGQVQEDTGNRRNLGNTRGGGFLRYDWAGGELSISGGIAGDAAASDSGFDLLRRPAVYGTVNAAFQF